MKKNSILRMPSWRCALCLSVCLFALCTASHSLSATSSSSSQCRLPLKDAIYRGGCGTMLGETPSLSLRRVERIASGKWHTDLKPVSVWSGTMTLRGEDSPIELEVYQGRTGVLRTEEGWFSVTNFSSNPTLRFGIDTSIKVPPGDLDVKIIERASLFFPSESRWDRNDTRHCNPAATSWSIYCAMEDATIEVTGGFHHRRPALELVRAIVDQRSENRDYAHRLMDYNNDPATKFDDLQSLFREALSRLQH